MAREQWRDIPGWEEFYQASNLGRIRSVDRVVPHAHHGTIRCKGRILKTATKNKAGHLGVSLVRGGVGHSFSAHKLIASTWLGDCPEGMEVRHGCGGSSDNSIKNIRYGTHGSNERDKERDGTGRHRPIKRSDGIKFGSTREAAKETSCGESGIWKACNGLRKTSAGFGWAYIEDSI